MQLEKKLITPYESYVILSFVGLLFILIVVLKLVLRDNQFLSNSELSIYAQPDLNQRKHNAIKKQRKHTILTSKLHKPFNDIPTLS